MRVTRESIETDGQPVASVALSSPGTFKIISDENGLAWISENGGPYEQILSGALPPAVSPWVEVAGNIREVVLTDTVSIGTAAPPAGAKFSVDTTTDPGVGQVAVQFRAGGQGQASSVVGTRRTRSAPLAPAALVFYSSAEVTGDPGDDPTSAQPAYLAVTARNGSAGQIAAFAAANFGGGAFDYTLTSLAGPIVVEPAALDGVVADVTIQGSDNIAGSPGGAVNIFGGQGGGPTAGGDINMRAGFPGGGGPAQSTIRVRSANLTSVAMTLDAIPAQSANLLRAIGQAGLDGFVIDALGEPELPQQVAGPGNGSSTLHWRGQSAAGAREITARLLADPVADSWALSFSDGAAEIALMGQRTGQNLFVLPPTTALQVGDDPGTGAQAAAGSGNVRFTRNTLVRARNATDTADYTVLENDATTTVVRLGSNTADCAIVDLTASNQCNLSLNGSTTAVITFTDADWFVPVNLEPVGAGASQPSEALRFVGTDGGAVLRDIHQNLRPSGATEFSLYWQDDAGNDVMRLYHDPAGETQLIIGGALAPVLGAGKVAVFDGNIDVTGIVDPTELHLTSGAGTTHRLLFGAGSTAAISGAAELALSYDETLAPADAARLSVAGGAYQSLASYVGNSLGAIVNGGNSFGVDVTIGTNDAATGVNLETGNVTAMRIAPALLGAAGQVLVNNIAVSSNNEQFRVTRSTAGTAATVAGARVDSTLTAVGVGAGGALIGFVSEALTQTNAAPLSMRGAQSRALHGSTAAVTEVIGHEATPQVTAGAAVAIGAVTTMVGYRASPFTGGQLSSAITNYRAVDAARVTTTAARTCTNATGIYVRDQGGDVAGKTNVIGIDIENQTNGATMNLGIRTTSPVVIGGPTNVSANEFLRNAGGSRLEGFLTEPAKAIAVAASPYTVLSTDHVLALEPAVGAGVNCTLPAPSASNDGQEFQIYDATGNGAVGNCVITPAAGTIDGAANYTISTAYGTITCRVDFAQNNYIITSRKV